MITMLIVMICMMIIIYSITEITENGEIKRGLRIILGCVLVVGLIFSYIPLQTNASAELTADEQPSTYEIQNLDYEYQYNSDITVQITDSSVDRIKLFAVDDNKPTDQAERMQDNPETTLEIPRDAESVVIITYNENGESVEETVINVEVTEENVPILDFRPV